MSGGTVAVVGGGVIGASCAYYLSRAGWRVTVLDRGGFGKGCSHGNCGLVCPSHILPLAAPGVPALALKSLLAPNSPFAIKPRIDPALWGWLFHFWRRCNERAMLESARGIQALLNSSRRLYDELMRDEPFDCEWETRGVLFVLLTRAGLEEHAHTARRMHETFGLVSTRYEGDALTELEPALKPGMAGGFHYPGDAHLRPDRLMTSWRRVLERRGVVILDNREVKGLIRDHGRVRALTTSDGEHPADAFVIAAGALTPAFQRQLGCKIPIQPGKGYSITMPRPARCPRYPLLLEEHRVAVTPMQSGYRLGSTMEFAGYDTTLNRRRLDLLREGARHYLHEPYCEPVEEEWCGWRPMTYDSKPIIDRSPALANIVIAAGHNMLGLSMAPATGKLVAELLNDAAPHLDPAPYSVKRF
ncbi:MAG: FAD-dependent oxidoreductase [Gemmataceae bacterium]|nr:FAD-dependent oxidoreductase [Gemmataceae bacterium]